MGNSVDCIIIDGWHQGEVVGLPRIAEELYLLRPKTITVCDCNGYEEFDSDSKKINYKLCFSSIDGKTALYSMTGNSIDFVKNRTSIIRKQPYSENEPLYYNCHDPKAVFERRLLNEQ